MNFGPVAFRLMVMIMLVNTMLFVTGNIPASEVPVISSLLSGVNINDTNTSAFQKNFILKDDSNQFLTTPIGESFSTTLLDFLQQIPLVGPIITFFRIIYEAAVTSTFGLSIILLKLQLPGVIVVPILVLNFIIVLFGVFEFLQSFVSARGGLK